MTSETTQPILTVRDLRTHYFTDEGTVRAVDGVNFDVFPGKTLGIVGESGCGKSVTARSILRIVESPGRIVSGSVVLRRSPPEKEVDLLTLRAESREMRAIQGGEIGLVFQEPMTSLSPIHLIGDQIVEAIVLHRRVTRAEARRRTIDLLGQVGIPKPERRVDEYPFQLSGGLRQRAMIAMALACSPRILIADEPTTALDVTTQAVILELLRRLQADTGMGMMLITHNMGVVAEMAAHVAVMYLGKQVEYGPVADIFSSAKHPYTQALLRSIPSFHSARRAKLPTISGSIPHPYNRPPGCPFHPRCPQAIAGKCEQVEPQPQNVGPGHEVVCHLYSHS